jgi:VIT1/CCC1 family predicted Fe2+/Mn2+ transporter
MVNLRKYSFGATAAIATSLAIIAGLDAFSNAKPGIIGALLVIGLADNISDSLGIHIYQESACTKPGKDSAVHTVTNFLTRLMLTLVFIGIVYFVPISYAAIVAAVFGLGILSVMSYLIALNQRVSPYKVILQHGGITVIVLLVSHFIGIFIKVLFPA